MERRVLDRGRRGGFGLRHDPPVARGGRATDWRWRFPTVEHGFGNLRDEAPRRRHDEIELIDQFLRRERRFGLVSDADELGDVLDHLAEHELRAARDHGHGPRTQRTQLGQAVRVALNVDRLVFNSVRRKKLFRAKAARSPRLPKNLEHLAHVFSLLSDL